MRVELPEIYPITDRRLSGLTHTQQVERLIDGGATLIQIREKHLSPAEFYEDALSAVAIAHGRGAKIIINDRVDIALAIHADGVHIGQDDLPPVEARKLLGEKAIIGFSTHSIAQVMAAKDLPVGYVAFGPVFSTRTKENPDPVVGLELLGEVRTINGNVPLVAIGGIDETNARAAIEAGADSVAVISALYKASEPAKAFAHLLNIVTTV